jgi:ketosteroid isomerase-like protein
MSKQNTAIAQQAYENFKTGNIQALLDQLSDDVTWQLPEIKGVPLAGKRTGRDDVRDFFATVARDQEVLEFEPLEAVAQGDKVVSLGHYKWRVKETGREFESDFVHVFTIRQGKIVAFREHFDSAVVAAAYQKAMTAKARKGI